jgi:hypothetical protein
MYNMDITIPVINYKVNLEILILIGIVYLIMAVHTVCSCCNISGIIETFRNSSGKNKDSRYKDARYRPIDKVNMKELNRDLNRMNKEGFVGANTNFGDSSPYDINSDTPIDTSAWMQPNMTVVPGQPLDPAVKAILDRPEQPFPLPEGEMLMFANTPFKPECCPNTYSNSSGCACMTVGQYNGLVTRGGNNVPYSEY